MSKICEVMLQVLLNLLDGRSVAMISASEGSKVWTVPRAEGWGKPTSNEDISGCFTSYYAKKEL